MNKQLILGHRSYALCIFLLLSLFAISCSSDDDSSLSDDDAIATDDDGNETPENRTSGFVIYGRTASDTSLATYIEELPEVGGTIDLSNGQDFPRFDPRTTYYSAMYLAPTDLNNGVEKFVVNSDGELISDGEIPTIQGAPQIAIRDAQTGVFSDRNTPDIISVFNPETLEITANIDMSAGPVPGDVLQRYQGFFLRGDDLFSIVRSADGGAQFTTFNVHHASLATNSYVGATQREGNGMATISNLGSYGQSFIDGQDNLYIPDAGNFEGGLIPARINRINAGTNEFDLTYTFEPAVVLNPQNIFLPLTLDFTVIGDQTAIAVVNATTPQEAIDIVLDAGGIQNLSLAQIQEILAILNNAESAVWCVLDLANETVTPISGVPGLGAFPTGNVFRDNNGEVIIPVNNTAGSAYYRLDASGSNATLAFNIIGASVPEVLNLGNNN